MKSLASVVLALGLVGVAVGQMTNETVERPTGIGARGVVVNDEPAFTPPPVVEVPAVTAEVEVVETVVTTNLVAVVATNRLARRERVVSTNATLRRFMVDIDENQNPVRFTSILSDGSMVVTPAGGVPAMTNRAALSTFNGMLRDVIGNGRRFASTNALWQARGTNGTPRLQRVWSSAGSLK